MVKCDRLLRLLFVIVQVYAVSERRQRERGATEGGGEKERTYHRENSFKNVRQFNDDVKKIREKENELKSFKNDRKTQKNNQDR